jgi:hypothetical protein
VRAAGPLLALGAAALLSSCAATHLVRFDPWRGMPDAVTAQLQGGTLPFSRDEVFRATGEVLENEPFFAWDLCQQDPRSGVVEASAPAGRLVHIQLTEIQLTDAPGLSAGAGCRLSLEIPRKPLQGEKSVWISRTDSLIVSAYDIEYSQRAPWTDVKAAFRLDKDYLVSAIYRRLTDRSAVPFSLEPLDGDPGDGAGKHP